MILGYFQRHVNTLQSSLCWIPEFFREFISHSLSKQTSIVYACMLGVVLSLLYTSVATQQLARYTIKMGTFDPLQLLQFHTFTASFNIFIIAKYPSKVICLLLGIYIVLLPKLVHCTCGSLTTLILLVFPHLLVLLYFPESRTDILKWCQ